MGDAAGVGVCEGSVAIVGGSVGSGAGGVVAVLMPGTSQATVVRAKMSKTTISLWIRIAIPIDKCSTANRQSIQRSGGKSKLASESLSVDPLKRPDNLLG